MSILGNRVVRREDPRFLTGDSTYVDDLRPSNAVELVYVRSPVAHGRIIERDVDDARSMRGVVGVFTGTGIAEMGTAPNVLPIFPEAMRRPYVASDIVGYVWQPVVAVLAETKAQALDAVEMVIVDYDTIPTVKKRRN